MRLSILAVVGTFALAASALPSLADVDAAVPSRTISIADQATTTTASTDSDRIVCKATGTTGSRLPVARVCKTQKEWDDMRAEDQKNLDKAQLLRSGPAGN